MSTAASLVYHLLHLSMNGGTIAAAELLPAAALGAVLALAACIMGTVAARMGQRVCVSNKEFRRRWWAAKTTDHARAASAVDYRIAHAAVMFTDAAGFSAAAERDEPEALRHLASDLRRIHEECRVHDGRVLKTTGDGVMAVFDSSSAALDCARSIQRSLAARPNRNGCLLHRIGIHAGAVCWLDGEAMGATVNIAARLEKEAPAGGICLSQSAVEGIALPHGVVYRGERSLRNISAPVNLYVVPAQNLGTPASVICLHTTARGQGLATGTRM